MKEMLMYRYENFIEAPIELVFECFNKDEHVSEWNSLFVENKYENGYEEFRVGAKSISIQKIDKKIIETETELVEYQAPFVSSIRGVSKEGVSTCRYAFEETEFGTQVTVEVRMIPKNLFYKIMMSMTRWMTKMVYEEEFENCEMYIYSLLDQEEEEDVI